MRARFGWFIFFFQAEDGIRDPLVTGVQTCALPIWGNGRLVAWASLAARSPETQALYQWIQQFSGERAASEAQATNLPLPLSSFIGRQRETADLRSEERRVGKERRTRSGRYSEKRKT